MEQSLTEQIFVLCQRNRTHLLLGGCFWSCRNLHLRKSTFGSLHSEENLNSKFRPNSCKRPVKDHTLQQGCMLGACTCTKNEPRHIHLPTILLWTWAISYDYVKNLRTPLFEDTSQWLLQYITRFCYCNVITTKFDQMQLSLRRLTKCSLSGTVCCFSGFRFRLNNFICKWRGIEQLY